MRTRSVCFRKSNKAGVAGAELRDQNTAVETGRSRVLQTMGRGLDFKCHDLI